MVRHRQSFLERLGLGPKDVGTVVLAFAGLVGYLKSNEKIDAASHQGGERYAFLVTQVANQQAEIRAMRKEIRGLKRHGSSVAVQSAPEDPERQPGIARRIISALWPFGNRG